MRHFIGLMCVPTLLALATLASLESQSAAAEKQAANKTTANRATAKATTTSNAAKVQRLLYVASPGVRNYVQWGGHGVLVFDIDQGHKFVKRISLKGYGVDSSGKILNIKGLCCHAGSSRLYVSTLRQLIAIDLRTDKVQWQHEFDLGCDRMSISPDGTTIYLPSLEKDVWYVVEASSGKEITRVTPKSRSHNTVYGLDGRSVYMAGLGSPLLSVADTSDHSISHTVGPFSDRIRPFTINGSQTLAFVNVNNLLGFEIGDLRTRKRIHRVEIEGFARGKPKRHGCPSHGIGLTPDEGEVWVCDGFNSHLHIFDTTPLPTLPPRQVHSIKLREQPGWVTFSLDGSLAYPSTGEVIDTKTRQIVARLSDEKGRPVHSEKLLEVDFQAGAPLRNGDQFGVGRRISPIAPTPPTEPRNAATSRGPNVVVIFIDDMGYADIGPFGAKGYSTPHLDRMAAEGMRFTDFETSSAVCSASRAALLTGCYHRRVGISGALGPKSRHGLNAEEMTIAELCKQKDYATACFGKWHLGHHTQFLPLQHGFDQYLGLPYSNDMWPYHPRFAKLPLDDPQRRKVYPDLPLIEGNKVIDDNVTGEDQTQLTTRYTERAVAFIEKNKSRPFFLYVPHSMVHVPLYVSDKFKGKSGAGLFGDVVMEVDWSVGQILSALKQHGLDRQTLVIFTSDNGPWLSYGNHAGSAAPLREGKGTMFEGGYRVPTVMRWPGKIPAGSTCDELASTIDILPTVAALTGTRLPQHKIDGKDIRQLMFAEPGARSPHEAFYCYYAGGQLQAVRDRRWKLHFPHGYRTLAGTAGGRDGLPVPYQQARTGEELYDLKNDIGETTNLAARHPDVVTRLRAIAKRARQDLGDKLQNKIGSGIRPAGRLP